MAQIGRATPASATTTIAANRPMAGASNVASLSRTPIEALNPKLGTSLEDGFLFQGFLAGRQPEPERSPAEPALGLVRSTSQAFAAFLEFETGPELGNEVGSRGGQTSFAGVLARAINTYETNARVISGSMVPRGATLSVNL